MVMNNGIDWEARFGRPPEQWTEGEFRMAMFATVNSQNKELTQMAIVVKELPCRATANTCTEVSKENTKSSREFKVEIIKGFFSLLAAAVSGGVLVALISYLLTGKP